MLPSSSAEPTPSAGAEPSLRAHRAQLLLARAAYEGAQEALGRALRQHVFFLFEAAGTSWALPVEAVTEVVPVAALSPIPGAPLWLRGLLQVGPTAYPVMDLAARLSGRALPCRLDDRLVLCGEGLSPFALLVPTVEAVRPLDDVREAREEEDAPAVEVLGVATRAQAPVWILSPTGLAAAARARAPLGGGATDGAPRVDGAEGTR